MKIWPGIIAAALLAGCQNPQQDTLVDRGAYQLETLHQAQGADQRIRFLVMHYTAEDFHSSLKTLTDEHVSAHYLLPAHPQREHGKPTVYRLVPEAMRAWHAGASAWRGRSNLNDTSIGIEIVNKGFTRSMLFTHWQPYTAEQIAVLIPLSRDIIQRYGIQPQDVVGHSDIAPQRKQDPGPLFPWRQLAQAGIGLVPEGRQIFPTLSVEENLIATAASRQMPASPPGTWPPSSTPPPSSTTTGCASTPPAPPPPSRC